MTIYEELAAERERAHRLHGDTSMETRAIADPHGVRRDILMEGLGEIAREFNEARHDQRPVDLDRLRVELIQLAAMATAWADRLPVPRLEQPEPPATRIPPHPMTDQEPTAKLHATTDASVWATEWCRVAGANFGEHAIDEGWMIGWFANAIECGRNAGLKVGLIGRLETIQILQAQMMELTEMLRRVVTDYGHVCDRDTYTCSMAVAQRFVAGIDSSSWHEVIATAFDTGTHPDELTEQQIREARIVAES